MLRDALVAAPRGVRPSRALMLGLALLALVHTARAQQDIDFNIPSQPLARALAAFSAATGIEVMVDARHAAGLQAPEVKGAMPPRDGLAQMLAGSELVAREFGPGTVTLVALSQGMRSGRDDQRYFGDVQRAIEQALCADTRTLPGRYRVALKLWIASSDEITRASRLDTTGDSMRDETLDTLLPRVSIGRLPPAHLVQPIVLVVSPIAASSATPCSAGAPLPHGAAIR